MTDTPIGATDRITFVLDLERSRLGVIAALLHMVGRVRQITVEPIEESKT